MAIFVVCFAALTDFIMNETAIRCLYRIRQNFRWGKLSRFLANRQSFPLESFAVYST